LLSSIIITKVIKGHFLNFFCLFTPCIIFALGFGPSLPVPPGHRQGGIRACAPLVAASQVTTSQALEMLCENVEIVPESEVLVDSDNEMFDVDDNCSRNSRGHSASYFRSDDTISILIPS